MEITNKFFNGASFKAALTRLFNARNTFQQDGTRESAFALLHSVNTFKQACDNARFQVRAHVADSGLTPSKLQQPGVLDDCVILCATVVSKADAQRALACIDACESNVLGGMRTLRFDASALVFGK